jgi:chromosome segregation ATPase
LENKLKQANINPPTVKETNNKSITDLSKGDSYQVNQYLSIIKKKDSEIARLTKQLEGQDGRITFEPKVRIQGVEFQPANKLNNDKLRESYSRLLEYTRELNIEKEKALESLRSETLLNEEQRNYIEMLKKTLESSIIKNGLGQMINSHKQGRDMSNIDAICEIASGNVNFDRYRKDLSKSQTLINDMSQEIKYLHHINEELFIKAERLKETVDGLLSQINDANEQIRRLQEEKSHYELHIEDLKVFNDKLKSELTETLSLLSRYERSSHEKEKQIKEIQFDTQHNLQSSRSDFDKKFKKVSDDYEKVIRDRVNFQNTFQQQMEEMKEMENEIRRLKEQIQFNEDEHEREKRLLTHDVDVIKKEKQLTEDKLNMLSGKLKEIEGEFKKTEDRLLETEKSYRDIRNQYETLKLDYEDLNKSATREKDADKRAIQDLEVRLENAKGEIAILTREKDTSYTNYMTNWNECTRLTNELDRLTDDYEMLKKTTKETDRQYETLLDEYDGLKSDNITLKHNNETLQGESKYIREKYEKDIGIKNNDLENLKRDNTTLKQKVSELNE